jgi:hypothetical protein
MPQMLGKSQGNTEFLEIRKKLGYLGPKWPTDQKKKLFSG